MKYKKKQLFLALVIFITGFVFGQISTSDNNSRNLGSTPGFIKVTRVIDGDTIELENGEKVRYIGINTPEIVDPRKPVQCFGKEASAKNKELVEGKIVRLEKDITDKDKYERLLRYVYVVGSTSSPQATSEKELFVNLELVEKGYAHSYTYPPDVKYQEEILEAEKEAREANLGLWKTCPISN